MSCSDEKSPHRILSTATSFIFVKLIGRVATKLKMEFKNMKSKEHF